MVSHSPFGTPGQAACRLCGRPLDANTAAMRNGICRAPACDAERTREAARTIQQRDWDQYRTASADRLRRAAPEIAALTDRTGQSLASMKLQILPRLTRPMTGPDPEVRAEFTAYLREIVDRSFAETATPQGSPGRATQAAPEPAIVLAACSTCKGDCCTLGGEHRAFLNADVISEFRALEPDLDADSVFQAYARRLADVTPEGSCQFHGPKGCTLERGMRADICNLHHCRPLKYLLHMDGIVGAERVALISMSDEGGKDGHRGGGQDAGPEAGQDGGDDRGAVEVTVVDGDDWHSADTAAAPAIDRQRCDEIVGHGLAWLPDVSPMIQPVRGPGPSERACKWCGQPITVNQATTTKSCGDDACERQREVELARGYGTGGAGSR